ncbi:GNAT family N-acetyltransferase [uncultured Clostridium sp.]|uniref:GNAT family N-acetyltransferase n=1 Tax=uncultured Clostridium sp. TaxID=59620 RepID=UPI00262D0560|nr:GNAT family N-acetyltransferase [uncultured Clostridium sp.]
MELLITDRLILRPWNINDSKDLFEYAKTDLVGPNAGWLPHKTEKESKNTILFFTKTKEVLAIVLKSENKVIGSISLHTSCPHKYLKNLNQRELGYALNPKYWGNEYIKEAALAVIDYAFNKINLDIIWCAHQDTNNNSKKVIEKLNFTYTFSKNLNNNSILYYYLKNPSNNISLTS